jgi:NtrC-family two-component system response regulator AlgB
VQHVLAKRGSASAVSHEALNSLKRYPWKGNVRELENVMERAILLGRGETIQIHHLPEEFQTLAGPEAGALSLEEVERRHIIGVLRVAKDKEEAARMLGIDPATLWRKRKKYGL